MADNQMEIKHNKDPYVWKYTINKHPAKNDKEVDEKSKMFYFSTNVNVQIYRELFDLFIQNSTLYKPILINIKEEYDKYIEHVKDKLKALLPTQEYLRTISQDCDNQIIRIKEKGNTEVKQLKMQNKKLQTQILLLKNESVTISSQNEHLTSELEKKVDECRSESSARKLLITELNELTSRLKETEALVKADSVDDDEDPIKLRIALNEAYKSIDSLQTRLWKFESDYEIQVPLTMYDEVKNELVEKTEQNKNLTEELGCIQNRYDLLQEQCIMANTYRDMYQVQISWIQKTMFSRNTFSAKLDLIIAILNKWKRAHDKSITDLQQIINDELAGLESGSANPLASWRQSTNPRSHNSNTQLDKRSLSFNRRD